jgi:hypothetical protein
VGQGLLLRLAWRAYVNGDYGQKLEFSAADVVSVLSRHYPFLCDKQGAIFAALERMPLLSYDGRASIFSFKKNLGYFLAAKHWIASAAGGDDEPFSSPLTQEISGYIFQGLDNLSRSEKAAFHDAALRRFQTARQAFQKSADAACVYAMQNALQPMARVDGANARAFLRELVMRPQSLPELVILSAARALARMGEEPAVAEYLRRLKTNARANKTNRGFYLYWLNDGRKTTDGPDWPLSLEVKDWRKTCRWLLEELGSPRGAALRAIHLRTFCDLAKAMGPAEANADEIARVRDFLERELAGVDSLARREFSAFKKACS